MKKLILFVTLLTIIMIQFAFTQSMNVFTKSGSTSYKLSDIDSITFVQSGGSNGSTVTDIDGNVYHTVTIGTQVWMKENLKTSRYNDGTPIPIETDGPTWGRATAGRRCWYENDSARYNSAYGELYNWYAVNAGKLAPEGWHVPTSAEWQTLLTYLGGAGVAGGKMKATGNKNDNSGLWA